MKLDLWILALAAALSFGAAQAQASKTDAKDDRKPKSAAKKKSAKGHKHKAGEKHQDDEDRPKAKSKGKS